MLRRLQQFEFSRFLVIGALLTAGYAMLYLIMRISLGGSLANALALGLLAPVNTQANRCYTFGVRGRAGLARQHAAGAVVYVLALALTTGSLRVLHALSPDASHLVEVTVLIAANGAATISRYVALRTWVFARPREGANVLLSLSSTDLGLRPQSAGCAASDSTPHRHQGCPTPLA